MQKEIEVWGELDRMARTTTTSLQRRRRGTEGKGEFVNNRRKGGRLERQTVHQAMRMAIRSKLRGTKDKACDINLAQLDLN